MGKSVKAHTTILTHMSIHYSEPVDMKDLRSSIVQHWRVLAAYDGMTISL